MPNQTPIPTQINIAPSGMTWKNWKLVHGTDGFTTRETMEKYLCNPDRVRDLEECRDLNLQTIKQLEALIQLYEAQMEAVGAGGVEPLRKRNKLHQIAEPANADAIKIANDIGANRIKVSATEDERLRFESWMAGHCWAVGGVWDGATYRGSTENGDYLDPQAMHTRQLFAAWRDCAALRDRIAPAPALEVERLREAAQRAHDWMDSQADSQSKGNYHSFDLFCLRQERDALAEAIAASQPNGEAA